MTLGFTGTQKGMTPVQQEAVYRLFVGQKLTIFHHGDCIGADLQAHGLALGMAARIHIHPPDLKDKRAFCKSGKMWPEQPYLKRNRVIAQEGIDGLVAAPKEFREQKRGSGTWATVRYARKLGRRIWIVFPDGTINEERNAN